MIPALLDSALDLSVVGGYSRIGYVLRSRSWPETDRDALGGRSVAITGATSGIGRASAELCLEAGARVLMLVRDTTRGERVRAELAQRYGSAAVELWECDLASLAAVRACAQGLLGAHDTLDVLVNNAGLLAPRRELSTDGIELSFATNVVGPFLLSALLVPALEGARGRIVNVSSGGMYTQGLHVEDLQMTRGEYDGVRAYARAKRAQVVLSELWATRLDSRRIGVHAMHPGWVDTPGIAAALPRFHRVLAPLLRSPEQGADTIAWLSSASALPSGRFWQDRRERPTHLLPWTRERPGERERLWTECARSSGLTELP
ncbi:MAG: SDR family NAD(P)-dependent oxidoreductase [Solirubrobacteraceae bacterium]|jgi:NAD(P)-dependent dehydrogenase (short-subunit alcohol dehydrogenase family)